MISLSGACLSVRDSVKKCGSYSVYNHRHSSGLCRGRGPACQEVCVWRKVRLNSIKRVGLICCHLFDTDRCLYGWMCVRFLVHRYSEMRRQVEANAIEGVDDVDTTEADKRQFNYDSDEVTGCFFVVVFLGFLC